MKRDQLLKSEDGSDLQEPPRVLTDAKRIQYALEQDRYIVEFDREL